MTQLRRNALRGLGTVAALGALTMTAGGSAWAHECFVANRSAQGNAAVGAHSAAWEEFSLKTVVMVFLRQSETVADCVVAAAPGAGVPTSFVFGNKQANGSDNVIAENNPNFATTGMASDGKGIDHAADVYGPAVGGLIIGCGGSLG